MKPTAGPDASTEFLHHWKCNRFSDWIIRIVLVATGVLCCQSTNAGPVEKDGGKATAEEDLHTGMWWT